MSLVRIDWHPDAEAMRRFGRTLFIGFALIGVVLWFFGGSYDATKAQGSVVWGPLPWFLLVPLGIWLVAIASPRAARPFYLVWMSIAFVMGTIISTVLLAAIYWVIFGLIAICFRIGGRDRLGLKPIKDRESNWVDRDAAPVETKRYEHQF